MKAEDLALLLMSGGLAFLCACAGLAVLFMVVTS